MENTTIELDELGQLLKSLRQKKGYSRSQVSKIIKKSVASIEGYEQGIREPTLITLQDLFSLYGYRVRFVVEARNGDIHSG